MSPDNSTSFSGPTMQGLPKAYNFDGLRLINQKLPHNFHEGAVLLPTQGLEDVLVWAALTSQI